MSRGPSCRLPAAIGLAIVTSSASTGPAARVAAESASMRSVEVITAFVLPVSRESSLLFPHDWTMPETRRGPCDGHHIAEAGSDPGKLGLRLARTASGAAGRIARAG